MWLIVRKLGLLAIGCASVSPTAQGRTPGIDYQSVLDGVAATHTDISGIYATLLPDAGGSAWSGAAHIGSNGNQDLSRPFRVASVTKLFVAAAILRLWENDRLRLEDPIVNYLTSATAASLTKAGYDVHAITIQNLLEHTAGIRDARDYFDAVLKDPHKHWTRAEQVDFTMARGGPIGQPGERYAYSDIGYLLLGEILERVTDSPLADAIRNLDRFAQLGLDSTYFEGLEKPIRPSARARQIIHSVDVTNFDPSFDPYGASGIVSTTGDIAKFLKALFDGKVFDRQETVFLAMQPIHVAKPVANSDTVDIFAGTSLVFERFNVGPFTCWGKMGWYSTIASYCPELAMTIVVTSIDATRPAGEATRGVYSQLGTAFYDRK